MLRALTFICASCCCCCCCWSLLRASCCCCLCLCSSCCLWASCSLLLCSSSCCWARAAAAAAAAASSSSRFSSSRLLNASSSSCFLRSSSWWGGKHRDSGRHFTSPNRWQSTRHVFASLPVCEGTPPVSFSPPLPAASPLIYGELPPVPVSPLPLFVCAVPLLALAAVLMPPPKDLQHWVSSQYPQRKVTRWNSSSKGFNASDGHCLNAPVFAAPVPLLPSVCVPPPVEPSGPPPTASSPLPPFWLSFPPHASPAPTVGLEIKNTLMVLSAETW